MVKISNNADLCKNKTDNKTEERETEKEKFNYTIEYKNR